MHLNEVGLSLLIFIQKHFHHLQIQGGLGTMLQGTRIMKQGSPILTGGALDLTIWKRFFYITPGEDADPRFVETVLV